MSQLSAWAVKQQAVRADRPADLEQGPHELRWARAAITDEGLVAVGVNGPLHEAEALRLGRWLVKTCGEDRPTCACKGTILGMGRHGEMTCFAAGAGDADPGLDWRAAVREWAGKVMFARAGSPFDEGWNAVLRALIQHLPALQPRRPSGLAARGEER